jgi:hypothetical protein
MTAQRSPRAQRNAQRKLDGSAPHRLRFHPARRPPQTQGVHDCRACDVGAVPDVVCDLPCSSRLRAIHTDRLDPDGVFAVLIPHVILAAAIVPPILITASRGLSAKYDKHRRIARWTLPLWLYVSVTGVIVYLMLYQM